MSRQQHTLQLSWASAQTRGCTKLWLKMRRSRLAPRRVCQCLVGVSI